MSNTVRLVFYSTVTLTFDLLIQTCEAINLRDWSSLDFWPFDFEILPVVKHIENISNALIFLRLSVFDSEARTLDIQTYTVLVVYHGYKNNPAINLWIPPLSVEAYRKQSTGPTCVEKYEQSHQNDMKQRQCLTDRRIGGIGIWWLMKGSKMKRCWRLISCFGALIVFFSSALNHHQRAYEQRLFEKIHHTLFVLIFVFLPFVLGWRAVVLGTSSRNSLAAHLSSCEVPGY